MLSLRIPETTSNVNRLANFGVDTPGTQIDVENRVEDVAQVSIVYYYGVNKF